MDSLKIDKLLEKINTLTTLYTERNAVYEQFKSNLDTGIKQAQEVELELQLEQEAHALLLALEEVWRKDFERGIEDIISEALQLVFNEDLRFKINVGIKGGSSAIDFTILHADGSETDMESEAGSLIEVVSFLLRVIMVKSHMPPLRQVVVLDEAFRGVDDAKMPAIAELIRKIVDESGIQLIMVSHDKRYTEIADQVVEVRKQGGTATVETHKEAV